MEARKSTILTNVVCSFSDCTTFVLHVSTHQPPWANTQLMHAAWGSKQEVAAFKNCIATSLMLVAIQYLGSNYPKESIVFCQPLLQRRMSKTADISRRPGQAPVKHHGSTAIRCEEFLCPCPQKGNTKSILAVSSPCQQKGNYARAVKFEAVGKHPESAFDRK